MRACVCVRACVRVCNPLPSMSIWCAVGRAVDMSVDHKPTDIVELRRIQTAGGHVGDDERVNGGLNLSRAIGKSRLLSSL